MIFMELSFFNNLLCATSFCWGFSGAWGRGLLSGVLGIGFLGDMGHNL
jgi:hypothetical protein